MLEKILKQEAFGCESQRSEMVAKRAWKVLGVADKRMKPSECKDNNSKFGATNNFNYGKRDWTLAS